MEPTATPAVGSVQRTSAAEMVFRTLYEWITTGVVEPGEHLPSQDKLAEQFDVSRNTLREAINKLAASGLVAAKQGVGTVVLPVSPAHHVPSLLGHLLLEPVSVREFVEARIFLEQTVVRLAAVRADQSALDRMRSNLVDQRRAIERGDDDTFISRDAAFHLTLAEASGNSVLAKFLVTTRELLNRFIAAGAKEPGAVERSYDHHRLILEALEARDPKRAELEMSRHLREAVLAAQDNLGLHLDLDQLFVGDRAA